MINILDLAGLNDEPKSQVKPPYPVLYDASGFFKKAPEHWNRNEKLAFIETIYQEKGLAASDMRLVIEISCSRGLSRKAFEASKAYGLHLHYKRRSR